MERIESKFEEFNESIVTVVKKLFKSEQKDYISRIDDLFMEFE